MSQIPPIETEIQYILQYAFKSSYPADRSSASQLCDEIHSLIKTKAYFQTQLIDGTGLSFILQPCDRSGRVTARFPFTYRNCLGDFDTTYKSENDNNSIPESKSTKPPKKSLSLWKKFKRVFFCGKNKKEIKR